MSLSNKIAKNSFIQIIGRVLSTLIALLPLALMTRYLGPEGFGNYTIIIAFLSFFGIMADMGIYLTALQMISEPGRDATKIFSNAFTARTIISIICFSSAPILALLFPYPAIVKQGIFITTIAFFFVSLSQILHAIFQKELKMFPAELSEIAGKIVMLISVIIVIYLKLNLLFIMLAIILCNFTHFLIKYLYSKKYIRIRFAFDKEIWREIFFKSWPIALSILFNLIYLRGDTIILSLFASKSQVGFYGASYKVLDVLTTVPIIFAGLMMPLFTAAYMEKNIEKLKKYLQISFDLSALLSIPIIIGTQFIAYKTMTLVAGANFYPAGGILKILIIAVNMIVFGTLFGHFSVAIGQQKTMRWGYLTTAILAIIGYFILIPKFGTAGAAWVTVFSETSIAIIAFAIIYKKIRLPISPTKLFKALISGAFMSLILYFIRDMNIFILILTGAFTYAGSLYIIGGIDKEMIESLMRN